MLNALRSALFTLLPKVCCLSFDCACATNAPGMPTERMVARGTTTARATISDNEPPPFDPYAAEATAVLVAKSALSAAKEELRSVEHRTSALLAPPEEEPFKAGAAPPAKKPGAPPPVDEAQEALVAEAQAAVAEAKAKVAEAKATHAAAEGTLRRRRLVQLAEKLEADVKAQKEAFREALRDTGAELTADVPKRAAAIEEERRRGASLRPKPKPNSKPTPTPNPDPDPDPDPDQARRCVGRARGRTRRSTAT